MLPLQLSSASAHVDSPFLKLSEWQRHYGLKPDLEVVLCLAQLRCTECLSCGRELSAIYILRFRRTHVALLIGPQTHQPPLIREYSCQYLLKHATSEAFLNEEVVEFLGDSTEVFSRVVQGPSPDAWAFWFDLHVSGSIAGPGAYRICEESLTNHTRIPTGILLLLG